MNDRDRMLAEGPRVAPEPPMAEGSVPAGPSPRPSPAASRDRAKKVPQGLIRLFPLGLFAVVLAANAGAGKYAFWVIVPIVVGVTLLRFVRKANK